MGFHSRSVFANASCGCQFGIRKCIVVKSLGNLLLGLARLDKAFTKPHSLNSLVLDCLTVNGDNAVDSHVSLVVSLCVLPVQIYRFGARVAKFSQQQHIASYHTMGRRHDRKEQARQLKELQEKMAEMQLAEMERVRKAEVADEVARVRAEEEKVRADRKKEERVRIVYADEALC